MLDFCKSCNFSFFDKKSVSEENLFVCIHLFFRLFCRISINLFMKTSRQLLSMKHGFSVKLSIKALFSAVYSLMENKLLFLAFNTLLQDSLKLIDNEKRYGTILLTNSYFVLYSILHSY